MADDKRDLERFLKDVDEIGSIITNLSSEEEEKRNEAVDASEEFMKLKQKQQTIRTKYDRTLVSGGSESSSKQQKSHEQEQFLKEIERDAKERADRRNKNEADVEKLKSKGNQEFKSGHYMEAVDYYTEAIKLVKYFPALYTNRAQAYIKLENYDAAIDDCKWAMRIDEKCVKAYVHYGRALQKKSCFSEAISYFKKAVVIDPKQKDAIKEYIIQTEKEQRKYDLESQVIVKHKIDPNFKKVEEMIKNLGENERNIKECIVCVRNLAALLENSDDEKILFRVLKGFNHFGKDTEFNKHCENCTIWNSVEEKNFVYEMLNLGKIAVFDNEDNVEELLNQQIIEMIHMLCHKCDVEKINVVSVQLLHQLTEFAIGRKRILNYAERNRKFLETLFLLLEKRNATSMIIMGCLNNLTLNEKFASNHSLQLEKLALSFFEKFLENQKDGSNSLDMDVMAQVPRVFSNFATLANLARVKEIRNRLQCNDKLWNVSLNVLTRYTGDLNRKEIGDMIYAELGLLMNLSTDDSTNLNSHAVNFLPFLLVMLTSENTNVVMRALGVLRLLMTYSEKVVQLVCAERSYVVILKIIEIALDESTISYGVKCLTLCTVKNEEARTYIAENNLAAFHNLLSSSNETIVGNSALILSTCFEQGKACDKFVGTSIVKDLLTLATRKDLTDGVKRNVAIALAKLVKYDLRFLEQLRELHGLEILHSVAQSNNLV